MIPVLAVVLALMTSADAVAILLNSSTSTSARRYARAKDMVEREAAAGFPLQQFVIGVTDPDRKRVQKYLDAARPKIQAMAEKRNNPLAWYLLSMEKNDLKMLKRAADGGNVQALNALGTIAISEVFNGRNVSTNDLERILAKSFGYFGKAAAQRDANGFINLGTCYMRGFGCKPDLNMAFDCYRFAAEQGHLEGMDNLSACYQLGHGVAKNDELSLFWRMRARAARGDEAAAKWLKEKQ